MGRLITINKLTDAGMVARLTDSRVPLIWALATAHIGNSNTVYIGGADLNGDAGVLASSERGIPLDPGESTLLPVLPNLNNAPYNLKTIAPYDAYETWLDVLSSGDGVSVTGLRPT